MNTAYTTTVVAPLQIALGVVLGGATAAVGLAFRAGLWPYSVGAFVIIVATGCYLSVLRLIVTGERVIIAGGHGGTRPRVIDAADIAATATTQLGWAQIFGIGLPVHRRCTRLAVRPGPTLGLTLRDGEVIYLSTADPDAARAVLAGTGKETS
jgi:hypothetical protein